MTGSTPIWNSRDGPNNSLFETTSVQSNDFINFSFAKYLGGHPLYQKSTNTGVYFYNDGIEIADPELRIQYSAMTRVENVNVNKIHREKLNLPLQQQLKNNAYTIIEYAERERERKMDNLNFEHSTIHSPNGGNDATNMITIVMDFDKNMDRVKTYIYTRMLETKKIEINDN